MLSFDYTVDLQSEDTLRSIDRLRSDILTLPLSPANELKLAWEGTAIRTWATLALSDHDIPKHHVATILAHHTKPTRATGMIHAIRTAYDHIHQSWRASPKPLTLSSLETLAATLSPKQPFSTEAEQELKGLLNFLDSERAHPVIQASIAHIHILTLPHISDAGLLARAVHYLLLAKYGYDLRGYATPERAWMEDAKTYTRLTMAYATNRHMTTWISFMAESMRRTLELLAADISASRFHIEFPKSFWELSDRQNDLMRLMSSPDYSVTNRKVQKRFRVSQITASRDLAKLVSLGLLYPHGKGRSVYYTKV